ncbi:MAG: type secretion system protein GspC [Verrucomicrobiaceae bacterium]|nr:type secretion system protein GspC [Verrucomicrobiaceae bacterium]
MPSQVLNDNWSRLQRNGSRWLSPLFQRAAGLGVERWRTVALIILAAWVIADVARLLWLLMPQPTPLTAVATPINLAVADAKKSGSAVDIDTMISWHLYGEVGAQAAHATVVEEQAQDTTLNLQLLGVISTSDPAQARAFILADGKQQQFVVGETLPGAGKVVLSKVLVDRAIIDNNGRYETLWLYDPAASARQPQPTGNAAAAAENPAATVDMRSNNQVTAMAQNYRQQLYQNPGSLADVIQVAPATEAGKLVGYRISPGRDQEQFQKFGFKPGDIVTGVNGIALDDPQRALELYNLIRTARDASITVRRGSEQMTMVVSLENND